MLSKRVEVADTRISVDVTCLRSTWQPVYRFAQAFGYRRHEPITGLVVEREPNPFKASGTADLFTQPCRPSPSVRGTAFQTPD
jgi:hypothetical protein